jgi:hypothetical protein
MRRWLVYLLLTLIHLTIILLFAVLLILQLLVVGLLYGATACLLLGWGGILTFLALLAAHELGHLLAARVVGLPFMRFTVGPLAVVREGGRLRARFNTAWFRHAAHVVHERAEGTRRSGRWAIIVLGGPLANLLIGAVCLAMAHWLNPGPPPELSSNAEPGWRNVALLFPGDWMTALLNLTALVSWGLGLGTLVPGKAGTCGQMVVSFWTCGEGKIGNRSFR